MKLIHISSTVATWILVSTTLMAATLDKPETTGDVVSATHSTPFLDQVLLKETEVLSANKPTLQPVEAKADQNKSVKVTCMLRNIDFTLPVESGSGTEKWVLFLGSDDNDQSFNSFRNTIGKVKIPEYNHEREFSLDVTTRFLKLRASREARNLSWRDFDLTEVLETSSLVNKVLQVDIRGPRGESQVLNAKA